MSKKGDDMNHKVNFTLSSLHNIIPVCMSTIGCHVTLSYYATLVAVIKCIARNSYSDIVKVYSNSEIYSRSSKWKKKMAVQKLLTALIITVAAVAQEVVYITPNNSSNGASCPSTTQ